MVVEDVEAMNVERINQLIKRIQSTSDDYFDMDLFMYPSRDGSNNAYHCGTVGCIAGHAVMLMENMIPSRAKVSVLNRCVWDRKMQIKGPELAGATATVAANWLGLSVRDASILFYASGTKVPLRSITRQQAVTMLKRLRDNGRIDISDWAEVTAKPKERTS